MRSCLKYRACWLALVGIVAVGCGNKNTVPVKGVVTLDGRPVEGAMVKFVPVAPKGHEASAMTDSSGSFSLGTLTERDGAWPGSYKVCVQKVFIDAADQGKVPDAPGEDPKKQGMDRAAIMKSMKYRKNLFPRKYMNGATTPLEATVPHDGPVLIDIKSEQEQGRKGA